MLSIFSCSFWPPVCLWRNVQICPFFLELYELFVYFGNYSLVGCIFFLKNFCLSIPLFLAVLGLRCCVRAFSCCGAWASHCSGFSCCGARPLGVWASVFVAPRLQSADSVVVAYGLSCSSACGISLDQGSNPCLLHWQMDSLPLSQQEAPWLHILQIFSPIPQTLFILFMLSFAVQKLLSLISSVCLCLLFFPLPQGTDPKNTVLISKSVLPMFASRNFLVSCLVFRSLIHFEFIFVYGVRNVLILFFFTWLSSFSSTTY